jgi:hypothetical protein
MRLLNHVLVVLLYLILPSPVVVLVVYVATAFLPDMMDLPRLL